MATPTERLHMYEAVEGTLMYVLDTLPPPDSLAAEPRVPFEFSNLEDAWTMTTLLLTTVKNLQACVEKGLTAEGDASLPQY